MTTEAGEVRRELEAIASDPDFELKSQALADGWDAREVGVEAVEPVLRFMESHPDIEYGSPGALVHFVERFHHRGYEQLLLDSLSRLPTGITTWMLNRLMNGTRDATLRRQYLQAMERASIHPKANVEIRRQACRFLTNACP